MIALLLILPIFNSQVACFSIASVANNPAFHSAGVHSPMVRYFLHSQFKRMYNSIFPFPLLFVFAFFFRSNTTDTQFCVIAFSCCGHRKTTLTKTNYFLPQFCSFQTDLPLLLTYHLKWQVSIFFSLWLSCSVLVRLSP